MSEWRWLMPTLYLIEFKDRQICILGKVSTSPQNRNTNQQSGIYSSEGWMTLIRSELITNTRPSSSVRPNGAGDTLFLPWISSLARWQEYSLQTEDIGRFVSRLVLRNWILHIDSDFMSSSSSMQLLVPASFSSGHTVLGARVIHGLWFQFKGKLNQHNANSCRFREMVDRVLAGIIEFSWTIHQSILIHLLLHSSAQHCTSFNGKPFRSLLY